MRRHKESFNNVDNAAKPDAVANPMWKVDHEKAQQEKVHQRILFGVFRRFPEGGNVL